MLPLPLRTRHSVDECVELLRNRKESRRGLLTYTQHAEADAFTLTSALKIGQLQVDLMHYRGQISADQEADGARIGGKFQSALGMRLLLWGPLIATVLALQYNRAWMRWLCTEWTHFVVFAILYSGVVGTVLMFTARRVQNNIYKFIESSLEAVDTRNV